MPEAAAVDGNRAYPDLQRPMELSELDRLEQSVKRAFDRIDSLEQERTVLTSENQDLKNRLKSLPSPAEVSRLQQAAQTISPAQLAQIKLRINRLIQRIGDIERSL
jgi:uncharacterized protein (UPF0335 family)